MLDHDVNHQRYLRLLAKPQGRKQAADVAWQQGYEAGWANGRNVGLAPGGRDLVDPLRALAHLETVLSPSLARAARPLLVQLAGLVRVDGDDTTTWDAA